MKQSILILLLIFISCKNESKTKAEKKPEIPIETENETEYKIDNSVSEMWHNYIVSNPESEEEKIPESDYFHNNREDANRLAELTRTGKKKATSSLFSLYAQYDMDLPKVGAKQIVTDFDGKAKAIIQNKSVDTIPFNKISENYAKLDMGTDVEPLKKWKKAHWDFFERFLKESGEQPTEDMLMVCVRFKTIWPKE